MAEGIFRRVAEEEGLAHLFDLDSAGMGDWHKGQAPDHRAQKAALARGVDISGQSARKVELEDFEEFDLILAMDGSNIADLEDIAPHGARQKIRRFLDFAPHVPEQDVPDPYYGGPNGFQLVYDLLDESLSNFLKKIIDDHGLK